MKRDAILDLVRTTLAADLACQPSDWLGDGVTLVEAREVEGGLRFPTRAKPFKMTTMGNGVVISCHAERMAWVAANLCHQSRDDLFSIATLAQIANFWLQTNKRWEGHFPSTFVAAIVFVLPHCQQALRWKFLSVSK